MNAIRLERIEVDVMNWYKEELPRIDKFIDDINSYEDKRRSEELDSKMELLWNEIWRGL